MKIDIHPTNGGAIVSDEHEGHLNKDGSPAFKRWTLNPDQIGPHMRGIDTAEHPWQSMSKGDRSAANDAANEHRKQRDS